MRPLLATSIFLLSLSCATQRAGTPAAAVGAEEGGTLPFIESDYARALGEARARGVPLFVDAWAPW